MNQSMFVDLKRRFIISLILTIPLFFLSEFFYKIFGVSIEFKGQEFVLLVLSTLIFFYGGFPFLKGSYKELQNLSPGMMTLIAIAIIISYLYSVSSLFIFYQETYFFELSTLIDIMLLGHIIEMKSVRQVTDVLGEIGKLLPAEAHLVKSDGKIQDVPIHRIKKGDTVLVRPGEKISADGIVTKGESEVNEAFLTGESVPILKSEGSKVTAGAINQFGSLTIKVEKDQKENYIAQVKNLVSKVLASKSEAQNLADRAAYWLTIIAFGFGVVSLLVWLYLQVSVSFAIERTVSVMITACPHALGLAIPLVIVVITTIAAKQGLLINNRTAFEDAHKIDTIIFDKTGTLTKGEFELTDILSLSKYNEKDLLKIAASIEQHAKHSIAVAILKMAEEENIDLELVLKSKTSSGKGISGVIENVEYFIGTSKFIEQSIDISQEKFQDALNKLNQFTQAGKISVFLATKDSILAIFAAEDVLRKESYKTCKELKKRDIKVGMITGDKYDIAKKVGDELGIDMIFAEVLPHQKAEKIKELRKKGFIIGMVGDGINDAPALAAANLGIAIGAGSDIAIQTADIILVTNNPKKVLSVLDLSKLMKRKMIQNLFWATAYNILALPLAAGVFYYQGIIITPSIGAIFMSISTVIVAINAQITKF